MNPIDETPKRKPVRKAPTARLSRSAGMGDIATPDAEDTAEDIQVEETETRLESISIAGGAVHAANIHGSRIQETVPYRPVTPTPASAPVVAPTIETAYAEPVASDDEKDFLAPDYNSFNLEQKPRRSGIATFFIWLLDIIIIIGIVALFLLYKYPTQTQTWIGKVFPKFAPQQAASTDTSSQSSSTAPVQMTFRTATSVTALAQVVDPKVQSQFSSLTVQSNADPSEVSSQNLTNDTILYQSAAQSQAQQLATYLTQQFGIQPQLQESDSLQESILLYLTTTLANPDLSNDVAAVYNASGVSGEAKQYCTILTNDKAASCSAANATAPATGLQISYKTEAQHFTLARISTFAAATFQAAPASQTQDIVITIGK